MQEDVGLFDAAFFGFTAEVASVRHPSGRDRLCQRERRLTYSCQCK